MDLLRSLKQNCLPACEMIHGSGHAPSQWFEVAFFQPVRSRVRLILRVLPTLISFGRFLMLDQMPSENQHVQTLQNLAAPHEEDDQRENLNRDASADDEARIQVFWGCLL
jgi:hypothetical protein